MKTTMFFLSQWLAAPLRTAAIAPSSHSLARLMTQEINEMTGPIVELGPGTGVFTDALRNRGVPESSLTLVELNPRFAALLRRRFPCARVLEMDAAELGGDAKLASAEAGAVLSGLGLPSMPARQVASILRGAFRCLRPGGAFYQFTYGPRCPISEQILDSLGLTSERIGGTFLNLPPAAVYRISCKMGVGLDGAEQAEAQTIVPFSEKRAVSGC
ncbi:methyltransferase domain-containing protein [Bosea sp. F3-2]|uniref:class I SAM-dependent methyltransferase n=1 Tax=Bosea sp. F3-2 TaxID=2599640 RepID=UPI0011ED22BC|nr:methyltransferase domain-containing protein [Bosea sp. F3-2]QEL25440.1 methyltransferase domain-containing protein [Bosea sp. F3-2]